MKEKFLLFLALCLLFFLLFLNLDFSSPKTTYLTPFKKSVISWFGKLIGKKEKAITLIAVGDVMLGRSVNAKMRLLNDFTYPFLKTASFLKEADITFANLESPFWQACPTTNEGMIFCADPQAVEGLVFAGIDIINLANNHIRNYGPRGISLTQNILSQNGIDFIGPENNLVVKKIRGTSFGFLGFDLTSSFDKEKIIEKIKRGAEKVDILVVSFHCGTEYGEKPSSKQVELAHQAVEAGANLILGHHPHIIQEVETYKQAKIIYSLGNFVFDQHWSEETKKGLVGIFTFQDRKLTNAEFKKVYIKNYCQPEIED